MAVTGPAPPDGPRAAVVALTPGGARLAPRVAAALGGAEVVAAEGSGAGAAGARIRALFAAGRPVVGVCAAGILVRALGGALADKRAEPPVVAVAEDGSAVVPLLGGHRGANGLARRIAGALGVPPAITTASELRLGAALDDPPAGWALANPGDAKAFAAALLAGAAVRPGALPPFLEGARLRRAADGALAVESTVRRAGGSAGRLVYHPRALALGVGCERGADPGEAAALAARALASAGLAEAAVGGVFSLDVKMDEPAVHAVAAAFGVEARFFTAAELEAERPRLRTPSEAVFRAVGCHGVAEGAALAAAGAGGELAVAKTVSGRATCAVARAPGPLGAAGRRRGRVLVVGTGPGGGGWLTPEAAAAVAAATDVVGYSRYLDLLGDRLRGRVRHDHALGEEAERARAALDLAAAGRTVALVSSGDPGIYAMASVLLEEVERGGRGDWRRVGVEVCPGVSALQAAAARAGAPLGHDFCAVSLSDLLTPWPVIERRLRAAAEGDFVVALYNPASRGRTRQLARARDLLLERRPAATPVVLARNLGRDGETVRVVALGELGPGDADMVTTVIVGSSRTRTVERGDGGRWVYTPRGHPPGDMGGDAGGGAVGGAGGAGG